MLTEKQRLSIAKVGEVVNSREESSINQALLPLFLEFEQSREFQKESVPLLISLLANFNHYAHEDIARLLQQARDPRAVDALYNAAVNIPGYQMDYDDGAALARKCIWALADIGSQEAYHKIQLLMQHNNPEIVSYAQKRMDRWYEELPRKAYQFNP